jgi:dihydrofolate synthase/folylpolyglutamate synthase
VRAETVPSLPHLARLESLGQRGIRLGLAAIDAVCERLGRPERRVPPVLVAGTNGKGSTAATLAAIAGESGLSAGLYTSPHLERVNERIRIRGNDIGDAELDAELGEVFAAADRAPEIPLTYFEAMTAAAFTAFARRSLDLAILEVGLGGRFDATNVAPAMLSVVTSISLDHVEDLGATIAAIAFEKAGVFRGGRPALVASRRPEALAVFEDVARQTGARLHRLADEVRVDVEDASFGGTRFSLSTPSGRYALGTPLAGVHQAENAAAAVRAAELLSPSFGIGPDAIARGVSFVRWAGRLERFSAKGRTVLVDGCHNADGARALAEFLAARESSADLVFGAMADKDVEAMGQFLAPAVRRIRFVRASDSPRAATPQELQRRFAPGRADACASEGLAAALEELLASPSADPIIVAGSLYLVGEARALLLSGRLA